VAKISGNKHDPEKRGPVFMLNKDAAGGSLMRKALLGTLFAAMLASPALAQTVKIGLIMCYSGQFADTASQMDNAIKLYVKQHGDTVAGRKIEFIRKDTGGIAPDVAKRLAQELVVRDKVDIIAGLILTPNALAVGDISAEAKKFTVIMNAATSIITEKSPYMARTSVTTPMLNQTLGHWAASKGGIKKVFTMVSDYGPGHDAEGAFHLGFKEGGGEIIGAVRFPVANPDFSAFVQRAKDANPDAIYIWIPGGAQPAAVAKALLERNIDLKKTKIIGQDVIADDSVLKGLGAQAAGIVSVTNYDYNRDTPLAKSFLKGFQEISGGRNPDIYAVGGYDGMHLIYESLKKTGGKTDGDALIAAAKGMKWESPRGPMSIDPETRDVIEDMHIMRVDLVDGKPKNVEFDTVKDVKDPVKERMKKKQ
jgi:branched-chain amino acid transport system substrate-binding protein